MRKVLWITLFLNLLVALAKLAAGFATATLSLIADGWHSLLDGSGNVVGLITLHLSHKPPDEDHQYGHRKFEILASMGISLLLFAAAGEIVVDSLSRFRGGTTPSPSWVTVVVALATLVVNIFVTRYESRVGRELKSPFLLADAEHTRSDVYATIGVLLAILLVKLGVPWADPVVAVAIGAMIIVAGWRIMMSGLDVIADRRVMDPAGVEEVILGFEGVRSCPRIRTRGFEDAAFLDLIVVLDSNLSLEEAHDLCDGIEEALHREYPQLADIVIHPEPDSGGAA